MWGNWRPEVYPLPGDYVSQLVFASSSTRKSQVEAMSIEVKPNSNLKAEMTAWLDAAVQGVRANAHQ
jgi:hypothetical protein